MQTVKLISQQLEKYQSFQVVELFYGMGLNMAHKFSKEIDLWLTPLHLETRKAKYK